MTYAEAVNYLITKASHPEKTQVINEIDCFTDFYAALQPAAH